MPADLDEDWRPLFRTVRRVRVGDVYVRYFDAGDGPRLILRSNARLVRWAFSELVHNLVAIDDEEITEVMRTLARPPVRRFFADLLKAAVGPRGIRREFLLLPRLRDLRVPTLLMW